MVKHVILWNLKEEYSAAEKEEIKKNIKAGIESLNGKIPGLIDIKVHITGLASSTADLMLDSTLESEEALKNYATHPLHLEAKEHFWNFLNERFCADYEL